MHVTRALKIITNNVQCAIVVVQNTNNVRNIIAASWHTFRRSALLCNVECCCSRTNQYIYCNKLRKFTNNSRHAQNHTHKQTKQQSVQQQNCKVIGRLCMRMRLSCQLAAGIDLNSNMHTHAQLFVRLYTLTCQPTVAYFKADYP